MAERKADFRGAALDSISGVKILLTDIARRLELKGQKFSVFTAASDEELNDLWTAILSIDQEFTFSKEDKVSAKNISPELTNFISHCCKQRHYLF